jgi:hypothetical protein
METNKQTKAAEKKKWQSAENITKMGPTRVFCITRGKSALIGHWDPPLRALSRQKIATANEKKR